MSGGRRDVEADLRQQLSRDAVASVAVLHRGTTTVEASLDYLVSRAFGDPQRLLDAMDLLDPQDAEARGLLDGTARRAADPRPPELPRPFSPPEAPRP
jgi:hypothetical protein